MQWTVSDGARLDGAVMLEHLEATTYKKFNIHPVCKHC